jgi:hypothetical protein
MALKVSQEVSIEDCQPVSSADVPEEVAGLLPTKPVDLTDEPCTHGLRVAKALQGVAEPRAFGGKEAFPGSHEVGRLVIVKPDARPQECRDLARLTGPEQIVDREGLHRRIGGTGLRLDREETKTQFLEETFVLACPNATELHKPRCDLVLLRGIFNSKSREVSITRHDDEWKAADKSVRPRRTT